MRVATFNANSIRARLPIVLEWLKKHSPDVLALQETKVPDPEFPESSFKELGYSSVFHGERGYNGVAIISRRPPLGVKIGFDETGSGGTRLISCRIGTISIVNTYVPQGVSPMSPEFEEKLNWLERLYQYFDARFSPNKPLVWVGDFNIAPEPEDVYDPAHLLGQVGFNPREHERLARFREWGLADVFRIHNREPGQYTFWDYRMTGALKRNRGWRIDHIWATGVLAKKSTGAWIDMEPRLLPKPSDHTFLVAEFKT